MAATEGLQRARWLGWQESSIAEVLVTNDDITQGWGDPSVGTVHGDQARGIGPRTHVRTARLWVPEKAGTG